MVLPDLELPPPIGSQISVRDGLRAEEVARARNIGAVYAIIGAITAVWAPTLDGHPALRLPIAVVMVCFSVGGLVTWWTARQGRYSRFVFRSFGAIAVVAGTAVLVYLGPFSATSLAVTLGIAFFGQGSDRPGAWVLCLSSIGLYLLVLLGILNGVTVDVGVFRGDEAGFGGQLFMTIMAPLVLLVTLVQARTAARATEEALEQVMEATLEEGRLNVQLAEAQAELDRLAANRQGGRMSSQQLGSYRLGRLLGRGGAGEVYEGLDQRNAGRVALKMLSLAVNEEPDAIRRFQREGEILSRLRSPHIARVMEHGRAPDGTPFIAMELLDGQDLAAILRGCSRLSLEEAARMVHEVSMGLREAHEAGIVHRDVKPHNLFRTNEGTWKVLDFGVAKLLHDGTQVTRGDVLGTPQYMAPEQALAEEVTVRADVYGLGAVLYRALTGRPPIESRGAAALVYAASRRPPRPRAVAPDLGEEVEAVLALAMAPEPSQRFETVHELDRSFTQAASGRLGPRYLERARAVPWARG